MKQYGTDNFSSLCEINTDFPLMFKSVYIIYHIYTHCKFANYKQTCFLLSIHKYRYTSIVLWRTFYNRYFFFGKFFSKGRIKKIFFWLSCSVCVFKEKCLLYILYILQEFSSNYYIKLSISYVLVHKNIIEGLNFFFFEYICYYVHM